MANKYLFFPTAVRVIVRKVSHYICQTMVWWLSDRLSLTETLLARSQFWKSELERPNEFQQTAQLPGSLASPWAESSSLDCQAARGEESFQNSKGSRRVYDLAFEKNIIVIWDDDLIWDSDIYQTAPSWGWRYWGGGFGTTKQDWGSLKTILGRKWQKYILM